VFLDTRITAYILIQVHCHFGGACCLRVKGRDMPINGRASNRQLEAVRRIFLAAVGRLVPNYYYYYYYYYIIWTEER
jgi:hypothetical protein